MKNNIKFTIFTDVHYNVNHESVSSKGIKGHESVKSFPKFINSLKNSKNDFIVNLGDLIDESGEKDLRNLVKLLKLINIPFYNVIGNHELEIANIKTIKKILGLKSSYYYKDLKGYRFVFLNCFDTKTSKPDSRRHSRIIGGNISKKQLNWLQKVLNTKKKVVLFSHKLLADQNLSKNLIWNKAPQRYTQVENSKEVRKILEKRKNVLAVFQGHIHQNSKNKVNGINYFSIQGFCQNKDYDSKKNASKSFTEVVINNKGVIIVKER